MTKILIVEDTPREWKVLQQICRKEAVCFPDTEEAFEWLRCLIMQYRGQPGNYAVVVEIQNCLADFIADSADEEVLCICNYRLPFYEKFLNGKPVVFVGSPADMDDIAHIKNLCKTTDNTSFVLKEPKQFEVAIRARIQAFVER